MPDSRLVEIACLMEATARKPGNVHPGAAFDDLNFDDFVRAAGVIGAPLAEANEVGLGQAIFDAVQATSGVTRSNVNLGIILLLAPMLAVRDDESLQSGLDRVLQNTTVDDSERVYAAIRLARPGGIGAAPTQDVAEQPTVNLTQAMSLAADRDRIAQQYDTGFELVFLARTKLVQLIAQRNDWEAAIVELQLWIMAGWPDTLIARKCGAGVAQQASAMAEAVLSTATGEETVDRVRLQEFDAWLRADGHRRNPGTTADLIAAALYAALRDDLIEAPSRDQILHRANQSA